MEREALSALNTLGAEQADGLLRQQDDLQAEAAALLVRCDLLQHLQSVGRAALIGSAALGLMMWQDIDVMVVAPGLSVAQAFAAMSPLIADPHVMQMRYLNQSGTFNEAGRPEDERYYFAIQYRTNEGTEWKIDLSFWLDGQRRRELDDLEGMRRRLSAETRLAILWIKEVWHLQPTYRTAVMSIDIYDAVLEHGVRTPHAFAGYLCERGKLAG